MSRMLITSEIALALRVSEWRVRDLIRRDLLPEVMRAGRCATIRDDQIEAIRERLTSAGHIHKPEAAHAAG